MMYSQPTEGRTLGRTGPVKSEICSVNIEYPVPIHGMRQPAAPTLGNRNGTHSHQDELDPLCGPLQPPRI